MTRLQSLLVQRDASGLVQLSREWIKDVEMRQVVGSDPLVWTCIKDALDISRDMMLALVKVTSVLVAQVPSNQQSCVEQGVLYRLLDIHHEHYRDDVVCMVAVGQCVSNTYTGNDSVQSTLCPVLLTTYEWLFMHDIRQIIKCGRDLLCHNDEQPNVVGMVMLRNMLTLPFWERKLVLSCVLGMLNKHTNGTFPFAEMVFIFVDRWITDKQIGRVLLQFEDVAMDAMSLLMLCKLVEAKLDAHEATDIPLLDMESMLIIVGMLVRLSGVAIRVIQHKITYNSAHGTILYTLCRLTARMTSGHYDKTPLLVTNIIPSCVELLHLLDETFAKDTKAKALSESVDDVDWDHIDCLKVLKVDLVNILGNLCFHCKTAQDEMAHCGGIPALLKHCNIDNHNPYIREHAIFAVRNALYQHPENQALVASMQPMSAVSSPVLQELGVQVELRDNKPHLSKP